MNRLTFPPAQFLLTEILPAHFELAILYRFCGGIENKNLAIITQRNRGRVPGGQKEAPYSEDRGLPVSPRHPLQLIPANPVDEYI